MYIYFNFEKFNSGLDIYIFSNQSPCIKKIGIYKDKWIDVEIWGDKPLGHAENDYAKKKETTLIYKFIKN